MNSIADTPSNWDQVGIDHNRAMSYIDAQLKVHYDPNWSKDQVFSFMKTCIHDFVVDSTSYDVKLTDEILDTTGYGNPLPTYSVINTLLDSMEVNSEITSREYTYMSRLAQIVYKDNLDSSTLCDSLNQIENDVQAVKWNPGEVSALNSVAVAVHSWDRRLIGWQFFDGVDGFSVGQMLVTDLGGAIAGAGIGALCGGQFGTGALIGAVVFSAIDVAQQKGVL